MNINVEIKGEIFCSSINEFYVKLKLRDERLDWFELDVENKEIQSHLQKEVDKNITVEEPTEK